MSARVTMANRWSVLVLGAAVALGVAGWAEPAAGQNAPSRGPGGAAPQPAPRPLAERLLIKGKTEAWIMTVDVYYPGQRLDTPPIDRLGEVRPGVTGPVGPITRPEWDRIMREAVKGVYFETAAMVFPVPQFTAAHRGQSGTLKGEVKLDNRVLTSEFKVTDGYQAGTRLARWEMRDVKGGKLRLSLELPVSCWEVTLDQREADALAWPTQAWPDAFKTALDPVYLVDYRDDQAEIAVNQKAVDDLVKSWLRGRDPKSVPPMMLAKELAGRVQEFCDTSRGNSTYSTVPDSFLGLLTMTTGEVIREKRCYKFDAPAFLSAVYRSVGIPSRVVYGYDISEEKGDSRRGRGKAFVHAWTEFGVMDKDGSVAWVPVDVIKLRRSSSRMQRLDRPWKYFGTNEDLAYCIPIAFQAHPPTGVVVRGLPAFWGWLCTPETPPYPHSVTINAMGQNSRQQRDNERAPGTR